MRRTIPRRRYPAKSRQATPNINEPVPRPFDAATVSPHERDVARFQSEDARTGMQTDEVPPTFKMMVPPKLSALKHLRPRMKGKY